jgi:arylsulfatase A-like enzyme
VLAYHDTIDKLAHAEGLGVGYDAALREADELVAGLRRSLPDDVIVVVTADHGQVDVGSASVSPSVSTLALVERMSGEGRFRWLHAQPGAAAELRVRVAEELSESCWVRSRREVCDGGWLGEVDDRNLDRLGDVAIVPFAKVFVPDPAEPREAGMKGRHGSLTAAEMLVPLIVG